MRMKKSSLSWEALYLVTFLISYLYTFNEWLFISTKPSYMNDMVFTQQLQILFFTSALIAGLCFLFLLPLMLLSLFPPFKKYQDMFIFFGSWLPALVGAALVFLLVDNFTYTVFKFGVVTSGGITRVLYALGFTLIAILAYMKTIATLNGINQGTKPRVLNPKLKSILMVGAVFVSVFFLEFNNHAKSAPLSIPTISGAKQQYPHILLITADGVDAAHTSLYGYARDTTPNLKKLAESSLIAVNNFSNSDHTTSSIVSIYTSKYPAQTRLFYMQHILNGDDAYEHLPGALRSIGYRTVQLTIPSFLDANQLNVLDGFDEIRMNRGLHSKYLNEINSAISSDKALFIDEILLRIVDRLRHIFFIRTMENPYLVVTIQENRADIERWENVKKELVNAKQPTFIHVHLMVTHGKRFFPEKQVFSTGQDIEYQSPWNLDLYDDSILDVDSNIGEVVDLLSKLNILDNTLIVFGSDHAKQWMLNNRLPLLFRFPHGEHAGKVQVNVQNLDIAPTILDYIGVSKPGWMQGKSILSGGLEQRMIIGISAFDEAYHSENGSSNRFTETSPYKTFSYINVIYCQNWFKLDLNNKSWESGFVEGSSSVCEQDRESFDQQAFKVIVKHLAENGFDVSTLVELSPSND